MSLTKGRPVLVGAVITAALLVAVGVGVLPRLGHSSPAALRTAAASTGDAGTAGAPPSSEPQSTDPASATATDPAPTAASPSAPSPSAATSASPATDEATASPAAAAAPGAPAPAESPAPARLAPGQRVNPSSAEVEAAINALHQRIPLFAPTDQQLRAFAEAVCASFDQGQTQAQVQSTVQEAVSHIQGASLSAADADFAVRTVVQLRCPGSLP